jgi:hypothetical protein
MPPSLGSATFTQVVEWVRNPYVCDSASTTTTTTSQAPTGCTPSTCKSKILFLHGGGMNGASMQAYADDLIDALRFESSGDAYDYEFVFPTAPHYDSSNSYVWVLDSPGGKDDPTTDPDWDQQARDMLDALVLEQGPFFMI